MGWVLKMFDSRLSVVIGTILLMQGSFLSTGTTTVRTTTTTTVSARRTSSLFLKSSQRNTGDKGSIPSCLMAKSARHGFLVASANVSHA
jgi:hypothetical protein